MKTYHINSKGGDIIFIQKILKKNGFKIDIDGKFGKQTLKAIKEFQHNNRLTVDGIVGEKTWKSLYKSYYGNEWEKYYTLKIKYEKGLIGDKIEIRPTNNNSLILPNMPYLSEGTFLISTFNNGLRVILHLLNQSFKELAHEHIELKKRISYYTNTSNFNKHLRNDMKLYCKEIITGSASPNNFLNSEWFKRKRGNKKKIIAFLTKYAQELKKITKSFYGYLKACKIWFKRISKVIPGLQWGLVAQYIIKAGYYWNLKNYEKMYETLVHVGVMIVENLAVDMAFAVAIIPGLVLSLIFFLIQYFLFNENHNNTLLPTCDLAEISAKNAAYVWNWN